MKKFDYAYILGVGGAAMNPIAKWLLWNGTTVFGYDKTPSTNTKSLQQLGVQISFDDNIGAIPQEILHNNDRAIVLYTSALGNKNPHNSTIFSYLSSNGFTLLRRHDFFRSLSQKYFTIAVAGTHGKTSLTALLADIFAKIKHRPAVSFVGGNLIEYNSNFITNCLPVDDYILIVEADEYDRFFHALDYDAAIITTCDCDHLDYYLSESEFYNAFHKFISFSSPQKPLLISRDVIQTLKLQQLNPGTFSYSTPSDDIYITKINSYASLAEIEYRSTPQNESHLFVTHYIGQKQLENLSAAIGLARLCGVSFEDISNAISTFQGVSRRFQTIKKSNKYTYIDDFAHHPVEISALLDSVKAIYPQKKFLIIFQSHTYTRTRDYFEGFVKILSTADAVFLLDIYPAREDDIYNISSLDLYKALTLKHKYIDLNLTSVLDQLKKDLDFDLILTVGAGDIFDKCASHILSWIEKNDS